jgi:hypothetical protein
MFLYFSFYFFEFIIAAVNTTAIIIEPTIFLAGIKCHLKGGCIKIFVPRLLDSKY